MAVQDYAPIYEAAGREWNIDPALLMAQGHQESGGKPALKGGLDELGIAQFRPATAAAIGLVDRANPEHSIWAQAKLMSQLLDKYKTPELALAGYNAGEGRVDDHIKNGTPLPTSTLNTYIPAVTANYRRFASDSSAARPASDAKPAEESDDAFLKRTGAPETDDAFLSRTAPKGVAEESDDAFLKRTGAIAAQTTAPAIASALPAHKIWSDIPVPPASPAPLPQSFVNPDNPTGGEGIIPPIAGSGQPVAGSTLAPSVLPDKLRAIGNALVDGFGSGPLSQSPEFAQKLSEAGIYPNANTSRFNPLPIINQLVVPPLLAGADLAMRSGGALFKGAQEAGIQAGLPRDIVAMPEAFMGSPGMLRSPAIIPAVQANALTARTVGAADAAAAEAGWRKVTPQAPATAGEIVATDKATGNQYAKPSGVVGDSGSGNLGVGQTGQSNSVNAAGTPAPLAEMPRAEMIAQRATAERAKAQETQPPGIDANNYVPGVNPTEAHMMQTAKTARDEKTLEREMPQEFQDMRRANNEVRSDYIKDISGTDTLVRRAEETRGIQADKDLKAAWANKSPADPAPVMETAQAILESEDGRRAAVRNAVNSVTREMVDAKGKPITDPQLLYGVRKSIDDMLSPEGMRDTPLNARVKSNLLALKESLDGVIEPAAPGFRQYLNNFSEASRPIDEMNVLQEYVNKKLFDTRNNLTYSGVQRMMRDLVEARSSNDINPAHSITDETMGKLWALRDDLRRVASSEDMAKARGSDTAANIIDTIKHVAATTAKGVGHAAAFAATGGNPIANMALTSGLNALTRNSRARTLQKGVDRALNPDRTNALAPPRQDQP